MLKKKLDAEGLFDPERKQPLPEVPERIGVVTSPSGAAIADILRVLGRRFPGVHVRLYPAAVQGERAVPEITAGLRWFSENEWADVVIVGRGGGSIEDLWAFNEEDVARAVAACPVPVVAAVGHQTDFTIADFVADLRAPTPSAAAEMVVPDKADLMDRLAGEQRRLRHTIRYRVESAKTRTLEAAVERPAALLRRRTREYELRTDELEGRLRDRLVGRLRESEREWRVMQHRLGQVDLRVRFGRARVRLERLNARSAAAGERMAQGLRARLDAASARLEALSPTAVLERGYAILTSEDGAVVRSSKEAQSGQLLRARLREGALGVRVESVDD